MHVPEHYFLCHHRNSFLLDFLFYHVLFVSTNFGHFIFLHGIFFYHTLCVSLHSLMCGSQEGPVGLNLPISFLHAEVSPLQVCTVQVQHRSRLLRPCGFFAKLAYLCFRFPTCEFSVHIHIKETMNFSRIIATHDS